MGREDVSRREEKSLDVPLVCTSPLVLQGVDGSIEALNKVCGDAYKTHYECLDNHNQQYKDCRPAERGLNACAFMKLVFQFREIRLTAGIGESGTWHTRRTNSIVAGTQSILRT